MQKKKKNSLQVNNMLDEVIETYTTMHGKKEPLGLGTLITKTKINREKRR